MLTLSKFPHYEKLGKDATTKICWGLDAYLNCEVALKLLKPALVADATAYARFRQEARAAALLFPYTVKVIIIKLYSWEG